MHGELCILSPQSWRSVPKDNPHAGISLQVQSMLPDQRPLLKLEGKNYDRWMVEKLAKVSERHCPRLCSNAEHKAGNRHGAGSADHSDSWPEREPPGRRIWGEDPVLITTKWYSLAAAGLESLIYEKRGEEKEEEGKA